MKTAKKINQSQLFIESIEVSSNSNSLHFPYKEILVNGNDFYIEKNITDKKKSKFYIKREENKIVKDIYFLEGLPNDEAFTTDGFIDLEIKVNDKKFIRSCENFFILKGMKDELIKEFFDAIASRYDSLIDKELNENIIKIMLMKIEKIINENKNNFSNKIKLLDYGVGTGISFEILNFYKELQNKVKDLDRKQMNNKNQISYLENKSIEKRKEESELQINKLNKEIKELQKIIKKNTKELDKIAELLEKYDLSGCDISIKMLEQCKYKGFFYVSPVEYSKSGFEDNHFDIILSVFVVHYFYNNAPYEEIKRILKPDGVFIFNTKPYDAKYGKLKYMRRNYDIWNDLSLIFKNIKRYEFKVKTFEKIRIVPIYICKK